MHWDCAVQSRSLFVYQYVVLPLFFLCCQLLSTQQHPSPTRVLHGYHPRAIASSRLPISPTNERLSLSYVGPFFLPHTSHAFQWHHRQPTAQNYYPPTMYVVSSCGKMQHANGQNNSSLNICGVRLMPSIGVESSSQRPPPSSSTYHSRNIQASHPTRSLRDPEIGSPLSSHLHSTSRSSWSHC